MRAATMGVSPPLRRNLSTYYRKNTYEFCEYHRKISTDFKLCFVIPYCNKIHGFLHFFVFVSHCCGIIAHLS